MLRIRECAPLLALALLALPGCVRVVTGPPPMPRVNQQAVLSQLALVVPITDTTMPYVTVPWHRARLTIGRHDGTMPEITHTFESTRTGLRSVGEFPALPPGPGYWLRVELVQSVPDGTERIVGRGWAGDEDEDGISLIQGGNLARLNIKPTMLGQQIALAPVRPPRVTEDDWRPSWNSDVVDVDARPAAVPLRPRAEGPTAPVYDYDDRKRERYELGSRAPEPEDEESEPAAFAAPPDDVDNDDDYDDDYGYEDDADDATDAADAADTATDEPDDSAASAGDDDAEPPSGDFIESFSAFSRNPVQP